MTLGRESVSWGTDIWGQLDQAVHAEVQRSAVATSCVPLTPAGPTTTTAPADVINLTAMTIDPSAVLPIVELSLGFSLTQQQVDDEADVHTALTLATRAANFVAQVEDLLIFQGDGVARPGQLGLVQQLGAAGAGLLAAATQTIPVSPTAPGRYGEHTFDAVVQAIGLLRNQGEAGPYALALNSAVYADTFVPVAGTLVMAADQIRPLVTAGFIDAGALPPGAGLVLSLGGNTMDVIMSVEPTTAFVQVDNQGLSQFRVFERWALRVKDPNAMVQLAFEP